jgi:alpha-aminoadipate/glutamate carrier protein LysW
LGTKKEAAIVVTCPVCESDIDVDEEEVDEGEIVSCPECGSDFEVVTTEPLELSKIEEEEDEEEEDEESEDGDY